MMSTTTTTNVKLGWQTEFERLHLLRARKAALTQVKRIGGKMSGDATTASADIRRDEQGP
jgi:hypothetical protein